MGWIIDAVIGVLLLIVLLINLFMGFQKCGLNNAFTALNVVLSCVLASVISGALISGPLASVVEGSGEGSELMGTLLSIGLFVVLMLVFSLIFSIVFFFVKLPLKKIQVKSKAMKIVGRVVSILLSVGIYASFFWIILGVVHTAGIPAIDEAIGSSFFYGTNPFQGLCDKYLNVGELIGALTGSLPGGN